MYVLFLHQYRTDRRAAGRECRQSCAMHWSGMLLAPTREGKKPLQFAPHVACFDWYQVHGKAAGCIIS